MTAEEVEQKLSRWEAGFMRGKDCLSVFHSPGRGDYNADVARVIFAEDGTVLRTEFQPD